MIARRGLLLAWIGCLTLVVAPAISAGAGETEGSPPVIFQTPLSPRIVAYSIQATLDPGEHLIKGRERVHWRNTTEDPVPEAWFHLYLNAFANSRTIFMAESSGRHRGNRQDKKHWGYCEVTSITLAGEGGGTTPLTQLFPGKDRTVMTVALPEPVPPGGEAVFDVVFQSRLPKVFARAGFAGDFVMAGQWFPKLGVYQQGKGWNCHAYHLNSEFFADFGVYDVSITVPRNYVVGATGVLWRETSNDKTRRLDYHAEDVHDFAWTASPSFLEVKDDWEGVGIRVLMQPGNAGHAPRYVAAVKEALKDFAAWLWKYPYPQITIVDVPRGAMGAGGMEYPMLITAMTNPLIPKSLLMPEMVVVHEFGHQYWYGMSANNEFEEAWLDEGINSYYEARIMDKWFGEHKSIMNGFLGLNAGDNDMQHRGYIQLPDSDPMVRDSWKYVSNASYSVISYSKSALVLKTLENILGKETMDKAMRTFFNSVKFTHTTSEDFIRILSESTGRDLRPLLEPLLYGTGTVDFQVLRVRNKVKKPIQGYNLGSTPPKPYAEKKAKKRRGEKKSYTSTVAVQRKGDLVLPVDILVTREEGKPTREHWDGKEPYVVFRYEGPKVVRVEIDPEGKILLDLNRLNNGWQDKGDGTAARALAVPFRILDQALFLILAVIL